MLALIDDTFDYGLRVCYMLKFCHVTKENWIKKLFFLREKMIIITQSLLRALFWTFISWNQVFEAINYSDILLPAINKSSVLKWIYMIIHFTVS